MIFTKNADGSISVDRWEAGDCTPEWVLWSCYPPHAVLVVVEAIGPLGLLERQPFLISDYDGEMRLARATPITPEEAVAILEKGR